MTRSISLLSFVPVHLGALAFGGCMLLSPGTSFAESAERAPKGILFRGQAHAVAAPSATSLKFSDESTNPPTRYSFEATDLYFGPAFSANVGFGLSDAFRVGLEGRYEVLPGAENLSGSMPHTSLDGWLRMGVGPTLSYRLRSKACLEVEAQVLFVRTGLLGARTLIGSPDNRFPLGEDLYGVLGGGQLIWRPFGWDSLLGLHFGVLGSVVHTGAGATDTNNSSLAAQFGVTLGY